MNKLNISVGELVAFAFRSGDITSVSLSSNRAIDGIKAHQKVQKKLSNELDKFSSEISITQLINIDGTEISISGRIDGIINDISTTIIEIKSVDISLEDLTEDYNLNHWSQGKIYGYLYAKQNCLNEINVELLYVNINSLETITFNKMFLVSDLESNVLAALSSYLKFAEHQTTHLIERDISINNLTFPFPNFRAGQKKLISGVYKTITSKNKLFVRAPTGIGKTMATVFPSLKALPIVGGKVFYLTAKTIGKEVVENTLNILKNNKLKLKYIVITAKEKLCPNPVKNCDKEYCMFAKGHYDRVNKALYETLELSDFYHRDLIQEQAKKHNVCPYELTLDLSLYCDLIICDYNYAFDPNAILRRYFIENIWYFSEQKHIVFLVDEAHNLVDRAREMYSTILVKKDVLDMKRLLGDKDKQLKKYLTKINKILIKKRKCCVDKDIVVEDTFEEEIVDLLKGVIHRIEKVFNTIKMSENANDILEFYFNCYDFIKKSELYDDCYVTIYNNESNKFFMKLYCLNPANNLSEYMKNADSTILFSATLSPLSYYVQVLGGDEESYGLNLTSPFNPNNLGLYIDNTISTKYQDRKRTYQQVVNIIHKTVKAEKGNYMVFFPSYDYMLDVYTEFIKIEDDEIDILLQERYLSEFEKEEFINEFQPDLKYSLLAFVVMGGMFAEGIDLIGDKLKGAIIIGVGLPSICLERNLIKQHFDKDCNNGFQYSYMYPGFNKVMQAAGRVIRTEQDKGIVVLIDKRFSSYSYRMLYPPEWNHFQLISSKTADTKLLDFWQSNRKG